MLGEHRNPDAISQPRPKEKRPVGFRRSGVNHRESAMEEDCRKRIAAVTARTADAKLTGGFLSRCFAERMAYNPRRRASPHCSLVNLVRSGRKQPKPVAASA